MKTHKFLCLERIPRQLKGAGAGVSLKQQVFKCRLPQVGICSHIVVKGHSQYIAHPIPFVMVVVNPCRVSLLMYTPVATPVWVSSGVWVLCHLCQPYADILVTIRHLR